MNAKRSQAEYEILFTKKNEKGKLLSNSEIASILNVSRISVWSARKKWLAKRSKEYEVIEDKESLKEITLPLNTFESLLNKTLESTSILKNEKNKAEFNYFSTINSLFNKLKERNKLKEDNKDISLLEIKIKNEVDILAKLKDYLFLTKLETKKKS